VTTGGDLLVRALEGLGVEVAFGLPGVHNLAVWRALPGSGLRMVGVRHEQTAGYAADGYARATGRLGVAVTTTGPGASNVVTAVGEAWACHSPVLVVATDIPTTLRREGAYRGVLHETVDQAGFFRPVTKAQLRAERAGDIATLVRVAAETALEHPRRPVYLEIPTDLLSATVPEPQEEGDYPPSRSTGHAQGSADHDSTASDSTDHDRTGHDRTDHDSTDHDSTDHDSAVAALAASRTPLVWAGGGAVASEAGDLVDRLARALGAPVLTSFGGRGVLPPDHPHLVPLPPHVREAGDLWDAADCVVVLGSDLDAMNTQGFRQPQPRSVVVVDLAEPVNVRADAWVQSDVATALARLVAALPGEPRAPWFERPAGRSAYRGPETDFLDALEAALPDDAVVVADMCVPGYWYGGFGRVAQPRGLAYPVGWGTLGFGFPASLGTALSGRPTVAVVGDGGFLFACGDLATAAQERLPVTVVLVDDGGYGMLAYDFTKDGEKPLGCDLEPPDFVAMARAFRVEAREVSVDELTAAVAEGIASGRPNLLVVKAQWTPPPTTSPRWYRAGA
jgi:thiamine pyrophosphate-dependent acetolactate synthase large subunit-like protein